jgi:formate-dependent nitrite reductase membrane component NrfD
LTLAANASDSPDSTRKRLSHFALIASATELLFAALIERNWRQNNTGAPLHKLPLAAAWLAGVLGLGILTPLFLHANQVVRRGESRRVSSLAALATLAGGFILRAVFVFGGNESARRPEDYFSLTQANVYSNAKEAELRPLQVKAMRQ